MSSMLSRNLDNVLIFGTRGEVTKKFFSSEIFSDIRKRKSDSGVFRSYSVPVPWHEFRLENKTFCQGRRNSYLERTIEKF